MRQWIYQNINLLKYHQYFKRTIAKNSKLVALNLCFMFYFSSTVLYVYSSDLLTKFVSVENDIP